MMKSGVFRDIDVQAQPDPAAALQLASRLFHDALPPETFALLHDRLLGDDPARRYGASTSHWHPFNRSPRSVVDEIITLFLRPLVPDGHDIIGAEWRLDAFPAERRAPWRFEKDEALAARVRFVRHPKYASVLYLTDGGPTIVTDQALSEGSRRYYDVARERVEPAHPDAGLLVLPVPNAFFAFPGWCRYGELAGRSTTGERATLHVNWWMAELTDARASSALPQPASLAPEVIYEGRAHPRAGAPAALERRHFAPLLGAASAKQ